MSINEQYTSSKYDNQIQINHEKNYGSENQCKSSKILRWQRYKCMKLNGINF